MKINIERMIEEAAGVENISELADFLQAKGMDVSERTLYRWKDGIGFNKNKVREAAKAVGLKLKDIIIIA